MVNRTTPQETFACAVCGEPARGFHFGAFTCEGCKSFFGRTCLRKNHERFECKNVGQCDVVGSNRTACKSCRFNRCLSVGMSPLNSRFGRRSKYFKVSMSNFSEAVDNTTCDLSSPTTTAQHYCTSFTANVLLTFPL